MNSSNEHHRIDQQISKRAKPKSCSRPCLIRRRSSSCVLLEESTQISQSVQKIAPNSNSKIKRNMAASKSVRLKSRTAADQLDVIEFRPVLKLNISQKHSLQSTWRQMREHYGDRPCEQIFQKLIQIHPRIKDLFYQQAFLTAFATSTSGATLRDHGKLLQKTLDDLIENVDNVPTVDKNLRRFREVGRKHAFLRKSTFKADSWERFGEAAVDVLNSFDCVKSNSDAARAWTVLVACITDELRNGYESEARRQSYTAERPQSACQ